VRISIITLFSISCSGASDRLPDPTQVALQRLDRDGSGGITAEELADPYADSIVQQHDTDESGAIDANELSVLLSGERTGTTASTTGPPVTHGQDGRRPHVTGPAQEAAAPSPRPLTHHPRR